MLRQYALRLLLRAVQGNVAMLQSGGGTIRGSVTAACARIGSSGAPVQMKSLVGKAIELDSQGGPVTLGACYADKATICSGEEGMAHSGRLK